MNDDSQRPDREAEAQPEAGDSVSGAGQAAEAQDAQAAASDAGPIDEDIDAVRARADENWDKYLRAMAELENVRKRASRDAEKARRFALESFARELLNVRDSLEMGLAAAAHTADDDPLKQGCKATLKLLSATMEQFGIEEVDPHGEPFDPQQHEAMTMQPSNEAEPGSVLTVYQKGYALNGRLLRPARVVVAQAPAEAGAGE